MEGVWLLIICICTMRFPLTFYCCNFWKAMKALATGRRSISLGLIQGSENVTLPITLRRRWHHTHGHLMLNALGIISRSFQRSLRALRQSRI